MLSRIVNGIIIEWNKIFYEEQNSKLNELIVEAFCCCSPCCAHSFIFSIGFLLYSLWVLHTRNMIIYCGWSSDEYFDRIASVASLFMALHGRKSLQAALLQTRFEFFQRTRWLRQVHCNWIKFPSGKCASNFMVNKTEPHDMTENKQAEKIDCDYDLFAAIFHSKKFDILLWIII